MSPNPFDQACRYLAKLEPALFLAWLLRLSPREFRFARWLDARHARFPGEPERTCDTVAFLEDLAQGFLPWAVPIEFQIEPDAEMFGRLLVYLGLLWLQERPSPERGDRFQVGAVVVNLTGTGRTSRQMNWPGAGLLTHLGVVERNLAGEDATALLAAVVAGQAPAVALPLIPLMHGGDEAGNIKTWLACASAEPDARRRADYGGLALVFAEAAGRRDVWKKALEGWNMVESQQVLEWQAQARTEGLRADILRLLELRQRKAVPEDLKGALTALTGLEALSRWFDAAAMADSFDVFRAAVGLPLPTSGNGNATP